mmetsp:Transcript_8900/g.27013  ORF Transcript_8900/g.27013 Transcript_8900/m.27013 type:complete len:234 (+) Transcript_8900:428-1129(+)
MRHVKVVHVGFYVPVLSQLLILEVLLDPELCNVPSVFALVWAQRCLRTHHSSMQRSGSLQGPNRQCTCHVVSGCVHGWPRRCMWRSSCAHCSGIPSLRALGRHMRPTHVGIGVGGTGGVWQMRPSYAHTQQRTELRGEPPTPGTEAQRCIDSHEPQAPRPCTAQTASNKQAPRRCAAPTAPSRRQLGCSVLKLTSPLLPPQRCGTQHRLCVGCIAGTCGATCTAAPPSSNPVT